MKRFSPRTKKKRDSVERRLLESEGVSNYSMKQCDGGSSVQTQEMQMDPEIIQ